MASIKASINPDWLDIFISLSRLPALQNLIHATGYSLPRGDAIHAAG
jgi:hypothetical protein